MKRKSILLGVLAAGAILLLTCLLLLVERNAPGASITKLPGALWYLLTTLTTVGYGDTYPVTGAGRAIGAVFQLLSLGVLAFLVSALLTALKGSLLPRLRLWFLRERTWYVFTAASAAAITLANGLHREEQGGVFLFCEEAAGLPTWAQTARIPLAALCRLQKGKGRFFLFCFGPDWAENEATAAALAGTGTRICCLSVCAADQLRTDWDRIDPYSLCARLYWRRFPVKNPRERIVLIGDGPWAEALLYQGLVGNVLDDPQALVYRVFGDYSAFQADHAFLSPLFAREEGNGRDALIFSQAEWMSDRETLLAADRIVFCGESEERTMQELTRLFRYVPVSAAVHARLSVPFDSAETFGGAGEIFTPELVLRARLDRLAAELHAHYRAVHGGPAWAELSDFLRRSNLASADHLETKARLLLNDDEPLTPEKAGRALAAFRAAPPEERERYRRIEHERWMRFHVLLNWQYGPERDNARRIHPLAQPYDSLSPEDQAKDDYAWELLETLSELPDAREV